MKLKTGLKALTAAVLLSLAGTSSSAYAFPVDFSYTPVPEALKALGIRGGKNVVVSGDIKGNVTLHIEDTDFDTAMKAITTIYNLSYKEQDGLVIIGTQKNLNTIEVYDLKHMDPELFKKQLEPILESNEDAVVNLDASTLTVMGSQSVQHRVKEMVARYDVAQKQVNIQATVVELSKGKARTLGLNYADNGWTRDTSVSLSNNNGFSFSLAASHEETLSHGKVLARPNITTFDGRKAKIVMGDQVPVFTSTGSGTDANASVNVEYKDVGVNLEVLPRINDSEKGIVTLTIKPSVSTITEWIESGNNKAPQISKRSAETIVRVKAGETILIGGLLKHDEIKNIKSFLPFFSKIPILGELFKTRSVDKSDTELVIAITPTIIYDAEGRPQVEFQKLPPTLQKEVQGLQDEKKAYNLSSEQQRDYEERLKLLQADKASLAEKNSQLEAKQKEVLASLKEAAAVNEKFLDLSQRYNEAVKELSEKDLRYKELEKKKDAEIQRVATERDALKKELQASNELMRQIAERIKKAGEH